MSNKHFGLNDMNPDNFRYYVKDPKKSFNPKKNYQLIKDTVKEYEEMRYGTSPELIEKSGEVADVLAGFAKFKLENGKSGTIEQYLGKTTLAKIWGDKLMSKVKTFESIKRLNKARGNTKFEDYYLV